ncbi:MAG: Fe-S cluster assembly transcriptional regulator IscR [Gammaproteobacteria bacterium]|jgi:Rrf2 family iron-sulfur cluster assembly transcriptional regulator|nr:Fe-S cluster assembly transcriptional regulator IscR [Gammaproteobacteria bacterium]MBT3489229.1 Fe-S cluster assembly transcriptional regulator IscR [Gammaproteobacteria bacterium]MBT3717462.1 Fe-S cluster assembly transcriptional regulator IscR [Gammaproteobacteria bacterium]MBT3845067.1 Fe-S cluster assembly transcriptional regulator IscR [Gammaproteobacteria bacterium]MBT3893096.1 Fe-S cluster assembly transcriptional regulator IscR [Gammaproteobacteria bacterium]
MRLTTKGRYAVTAMLDLAINAEQGPITLSEISGRQEISLSYLEQLFSKLRKQGLVKSSRGPGGGYQLAQSANDISISQIILAVDEAIDVRRCQGDGNCQGDRSCLTHDLWTDLSEQIQGFLGSISLGKLTSDRVLKEGCQSEYAEERQAVVA